MATIRQGDPGYSELLSAWRSQATPTGPKPMQLLAGGVTYAVTPVDDENAVFVEVDSQGFIDGKTSFTHGS